MAGSTTGTAPVVVGLVGVARSRCIEPDRQTRGACLWPAHRSPTRPLGRNHEAGLVEQRWGMDDAGTRVGRQSNGRKDVEPGQLVRHEAQVRSVAGPPHPQTEHCSMRERVLQRRSFGCESERSVRVRRLMAYFAVHPQVADPFRHATGDNGGGAVRWV